MTRDARHQDEDGVIGDRPARDQLAGLPMFPSVAEAEAALRRDFLAAPPEREAAQTGTFDAITDRERVAGIERIQREVRDPLLAIALLRKDLPTDPGVTATDVRVLAEQRGLAHLVGTQQRAWSWLPTYLATICRQGHLVKYRVAGMVVRRMADNGNAHVVYLHPYDHRARTAA